MVILNFGSIGWIFVALVSGAAVLSMVRRRILRRPSLTARHHRGRVLRAAREVQQSLGRVDEGFQWGRCLLPARVAYGHLAVVGATGSGKTLLQRLLMQSVLPHIGTHPGQRALIYDAKQDILGLLGGMDLRCRIDLLNPLDSRSVAWDLAADVTSPAAAWQAATLLIPKATHDANPFFSNAARHLLYGVLLAFMLHAPLKWTLRQLVLVLRQERLLRSLLANHDATGYLLQYFEHPSTFQNILSTLLTRMAPYEIIAAAWDRSRSKISLRQWVDSDSILVLGNDEDNRAAIDTLNQLIFKRLSELILARPELKPEESETTWLLLDEVRQAGKLDGLSALMTKGRSKGAAVLLGFQDINGLRDVYGREVADELVGQCNTKAILRLNSPETANWASRIVGSSEFLETRKSRSRSRDVRDHGLHEGASFGVSFSDAITKRDLILDSEFLDFPETSLEAGLSGVFVSPVTGAFRDHLPGRWLGDRLRSPLPDFRNFIPRPEAHQYLRPWSNQDSDIFKLAERPASASLIRAAHE
ncbi:MAG: type IV secretion system DNA-binding domain-containing protein [Verrucomicrobiales bacterium]|nr:type IV secretion system DNA-binding domain-containing protein [Verrucomicrobiales bacterium]